MKLTSIAALIKSEFNTLFYTDKGVSFSDLLYKTPLCWLDIDQIFMSPKYKERFLLGGLSVSYSTVNCPDGQPFGDWSIMGL